MADNVARIIAGASAAFTAVGMVISFATYRRVRPRLRVRASFGVVTVVRTNERSCHLHVRIRNHGQTAVQLSKAEVQFREGRMRRMREALSGRLRSYGHIWYPVLPAEATMEAAAFDGAQWHIELNDADLSTLETAGSRVRVGVELSSGIVAYDGWRRTPSWLSGSRNGAEGND
ncbi:hypothetical protein ACGFOM_24970 [Streptomyces sp. NPDC048594]|uniref:hypothetical protein n=1 Tax=Streptomyces sp. NPDC048594 TaxID=3365575 RepID=UPI00371E0C17